METGAGGAEMADIGKEQGRGLSELFSDQPVSGVEQCTYFL